MTDGSRVTEMQTDAELIVKLATEVMGAPPPERAFLQRLAGYTDKYRIGRSYLLVHSDDSPYIHKIEGWNPLASDDDAFALVDAMESRHQYCLGTLERIWNHWPSGDDWIPKMEGWKCSFKSLDQTHKHSVFLPTATDPDRRRAIVLAALKTLEAR